MRLRTLTVTTVAAALAVVGPAAPALAHGDEADPQKQVRTALADLATEGTGMGMEPVANLPYRTMQAGAAPNGSDIEFMRLGSKEFALAGTLRQGMQIIDITDPEQPSQVGHYACPVNQGDVQVFRQGGRVLATYTADSRINTAPGFAESACVTEANALGADIDGREFGTFLVDVTNPRKPKTVGFLEVPAGSHNMTVHPSGDYLYNSNSDLVTATAQRGAKPFITIFDIRDPRNPTFVQEFPIPFVPTSLGTESHDVTFSEDGSRAYSAALSQTLVLDTEDPANPRIVSQILDPAIQVVHQSDPFTLTRADGSEREILAITDERAGAAGAAECPGGGVHFYDVTDEENPTKISAFANGDLRPSDDPLQACTSHVLRVHPDQGLLTIAWYQQGVRVFDISGLADYDGAPGFFLGSGGGTTEVGFYEFPDSDTWSFKTNKIAADGSFYGFGNDMSRGLDVYKFDGLERQVPALTTVDLAAGLPLSEDLDAGGLVTGASTSALALPLLAVGGLAGAVGLLRRRRAVAAV